MYCLIVVAISALFLFIGINNLSTKDKKLREAKEQQELYRTKLNEISKRTGEYNKEIRLISRKWKSKVKFSNSLITKKAYNIIGKLNVIEKLLPSGVYIKDISIKVNPSSIIEFTVVSDSFNNLFQVYKSFSKYDPTIHKELESDGIFTSSIKLKLTLEKEVEKKALENEDEKKVLEKEDKKKSVEKEEENKTLEKEDEKK